MQKNRSILSLVRALFVSAIGISAPTFAQNVNVNPGAGTYPTLADAFAAINAGTHTGAITVDIVADTTEPVVVGSASAILNASGAGGASYTSIVISPSGGAARTISGAATAGFALIDLNGADNVTINGLNAGGNTLTIANTTVSATSGTSTIRFIGGATNNTITNSNIQGSGTMPVATNGAVIFFSTDVVTTNGNDNNTISNNNIGPAGANLPTKGILGNGSTSTTAIGNSGISITNNNIFDFFGAASTSAGIATNGGCNAWSITNNRLFQTGARTWTTGALHSAINIGNTSAASGAQAFTITGNIVGFASNSQTGIYTLSGAGTGAKFVGILFNGIASGGLPTNVNNNTVAAVSMTGVVSSGTTASSPFTGILFQEGNGITNGNIIGSQAATGSLVFSTTTTSATDIYGIHNFSSNAWTSNNNNIGGISATNLGASGTILLFGMRAFTGSTVTWNANGNSVGGPVANSLQLSATGANSQVVGMFTSNAPAVLTSNVVRNLTSNIGTGTTTAASVIGINITAVTPNHTVSQNTISSLTNTNAAAATVVTGLQFTGGTANVVARNQIFGLTSSTSSASAEVNGIRVSGGTTIYRNNMIALGEGITNSIGSAATNSNVSGVNGIIEFLGTNSFFHNSVYIGGSPTIGAGASYAFNGNQTVNTRSFRNNIFFNARSNAGATGSHYAVKINGSVPNPAGLTINNNLYFANGTGAVFGFFNSLNVVNIAAWKLAVGQDSVSFESNPQFLDPTNPTPDLHLHPTTPTIAEGNGADVGVLDDFDGQARSGLSPIDIGADAGNFSGIDLSPPAISYTPFANTSLFTNRTISVGIVDITAVATGGLAPRIYYRKNAGAYFSQACGLASGTLQNGSWGCTINNADFGGVVVADVISYFVIAQDTLGNLASNAVGAVATDVNTVTTPPSTPNSYSIAATIGGIRTVCAAGCDFTTLTGAGGAFSVINTSVAVGNVELQIAGDLIVGEDGSNRLNALAEQPSASNFTVRIYPTGIARVITGSFNGALIRMFGASRVTIDGSIGGAGTDRSLTIQNNSVTTPNVVLFGSVGSTPITDGVLKNCIIINGALTSSAVVISDGTTVGTAGFFSNITIQNNDVQRAFVGVFATGGTSPQNGSNLVYTQNTVNTSGANAVRNVGLYMQGVNGATVSQNTVGNFSPIEGENDTGIWLASGTTNADVTENTVANLGMTLTTAFAPFGMRESSGLALSGNSFTGNTITNLSTTGGTGLRGIALSSGGVTVQSNKIRSINNNSTGTFGAFGIDVIGGDNSVIRNNFVSDINHNMTGGDAFDANFGVVGIRVGAGNGHKIYFNSVNLFGVHPGTANTNLLSAAFAISAATQTGIDVRNNIFANNMTGGTTSIAHVSVFLPAAGTSAMNLTWNNNAYYFGTDVASQGVGQAGVTAGTNFFTTLAAMAAYTSTLSPAATNDNASIAASTAVPFTSNSDLHVGVGSAVVNVGTPIAGVIVDIDGDPRTAPLPEIGADELVDPNTPPTITPEAAGISRQRDTAASTSTIAVVSDTETLAGSLVVTVNGALPTGISVSGISNSGGTVSASVAASCSAALGDNFVGLRVTDGGALFTDANLTVNVTANSPPTLGTYGATNVVVGAGNTVTPSAPPSDNGTISTITASAPLFTGTFSVNTGTGVVTVSNAGPAGVYTVTVLATDACGDTSQTTFQLTVSNANAAPTITTVAGLTRQAGSPASNSTIATVTDDAGAGTVVVTSSGPANGFTLSNIVNTNGTVTADLIASCTATNSIFTLTATDTGALTATGDILPTVIANTPPTLGTYGVTSINTGAGTTVNPSAPPADNGTISTIVASAPLFTGTFSVNTATGVVTITNAGPAGVYTVTVLATDACGATSQTTFQLTVNAPNTAPTISATAGVSKRQGDPSSVTQIATVLDAEDAENILVVTVNGGATATNNGVGVASIAVNNLGVVTANVVASCSATAASFTLRVTDSGALFNEATLNVVVNPNLAPILGYNPRFVLNGGSATIAPDAGPSDTGTIASVILQSAGTYSGTIGVTAGVVSISNAAPVGTHNIIVRVADNCGLTTDSSLSLTVLGDDVFANGFEDPARNTSKVNLPMDVTGASRTLSLPIESLSTISDGGELINMFEFNIGSSYYTMQVQGRGVETEVRLIRGTAGSLDQTTSWNRIVGARELQLVWSGNENNNRNSVDARLNLVQ